MSCYLARRAWNFWLNLSTKVSSMKTFNELAGGDFLEFDSLLTFGEFIRRVYLNIQSEITHERYYAIRLIIYVRKGNETLRVLTHVMTRKVQSSYQILSIFSRIFNIPYLIHPSQIRGNKLIILPRENEFAGRNVCGILSKYHLILPTRLTTTSLPRRINLIIGDKKAHNTSLTPFPRANNA